MNICTGNKVRLLQIACLLILGMLCSLESLGNNMQWFITTNSGQTVEMRLVGKLVVSGDANTFDIVGHDGEILASGACEAKFELLTADIVPGDADGNKKVNSDDIKEIVNTIMGTPSNWFNFFSADANRDNSINVADIVTTSRIAGISRGKTRAQSNSNLFSGVKFLVTRQEGEEQEISSTKAIVFVRDGGEDRYAWQAIENNAESYATLGESFDIKNVKSVKLFAESDNQFTVNLPKNAPFVKEDVNVVAYGEKVKPTSDNIYVTGASAVSVLNKDGKVIYECYASLDNQIAQRSVELNALETAYTMLLPLFPHVFEPTPDEILATLKSLLAELPETHALANAIDESITKNGYLNIDDVETEYQAAVDCIIDKLGLRNNYLKETSTNKTRSSLPRDPYIVNGNSVYGYKLVMNDCKWVENDLAKVWRCNLTAYNSNRFAYTSWVRGYKDSDGLAHYYDDDYDVLRKSILKPQRVSTFMGTFTDPFSKPFKIESWEGIANYFVDSYKLFFEEDFGFADMTWDNTKKTLDMTFLSSNDVVIVSGPADNQLMMYYNVLKSIMDPIIKKIAKNLTDSEEDDYMLNFCIDLVADNDYREGFSEIIHSNKSYGAKAREILVLTWPKMTKHLDKYLEKLVKDKGPQFVWDHYSFMAAGELQRVLDVIEIAENWNKLLETTEKVGDVCLGVLGLMEGSFYYDVSLDFGQDKKLALETDEISVDEGKYKLVKITSGNGDYTIESSDLEVANATIEGIASSEEGTVFAIKISAKKEGTCSITVKDVLTRLTANIEVNVERLIVDLGLPSGTLWASRNVGASKCEDYGGYYAWGETSEKNTYSWNNYKYCDGTSSVMTKYCTYNYYGNVDGKTTLESMDDAATMNWGYDWRMPTKEELEELKTQCKWTAERVNGVNGYRVTGKNGNSIFLPFGGSKYDDVLSNAGHTGFYMSSSLAGSTATPALYMYSGKIDFMNYTREQGLSIRPVVRNRSEDDSRLDEIVPDDMRLNIEKYMPIYNGIHPPKIEGVFKINPMVAVFCQDYPKGGYAPGEFYGSNVLRFSNFNTDNNTLDLDHYFENKNEKGSGPGAFISGYGNNFTAFFNVEGTTNGIWTKSVEFVSGTVTDEGIKDAYYGLLMVDKGNDPYGKVMQVGYFRIYKDKDALSVFSTWNMK